MAMVDLYLRRSSPGEEDANYSLEDQETVARKWTAEGQHNLRSVWKDPGGNSRTLKRRVLQQMMWEARQGLFDTLIVWRYDRFSRVASQQAQAIYQLGQYGVQVVSVTQPVPDGPIGDMLRNHYGFASEMEGEGITSLVYGGRKRSAEQGDIPGAPHA